MNNSVPCGCIGFPSSFAAFKWLAENARGQVSWFLNGRSAPYLYEPTEVNKTVTLERKGARRTVILRQMPHDEQAVVGGKFRYGSGAKWNVLEVL